MAMYNLYWEINDLLKKYGLVRIKRTGRTQEKEVWIEPYEELKIEIIASRAPKAVVRLAMAAAMRVRQGEGR